MSDHAPTTWLILPLKDFVNAKQRLSGVLAAHERRTLFQVMVEDMLTTLTGCGRFHDIVLISDDPTAELLADKYRLTFLAETPKHQRPAGISGLNAAVSQAVAYVNEQQAGRGLGGTVLILHGDLPLLQPEDIDALLAARAEYVVLGTDRRGLGTNALRSPLPCTLEFHYGQNSRSLHHADAESRGLVVETLRLERLGQDIDEPVDLVCLSQQLLEHAELAPRTADYLERSGIRLRLQQLELGQTDAPALVLREAY